MFPKSCQGHTSVELKLASRLDAQTQPQESIVDSLSHEY